MLGLTTTKMVIQTVQLQGNKLKQVKITRITESKLKIRSNSKVISTRNQVYRLTETTLSKTFSSRHFQHKTRKLTGLIAMSIQTITIVKMVIKPIQIQTAMRIYNSINSSKCHHLYGQFPCLTTVVKRSTTLDRKKKSSKIVVPVKTKISKHSNNIIRTGRLGRKSMSRFRRFGTRSLIMEIRAISKLTSRFNTLTILILVIKF